MAISVFLDPAQMPARTQDQTTFDNLMAQYYQLLPTFAAQINATEAGMNAVAAGGAYAIPYVVDFSSNADSDPGAGKLRFNSATQSAATALYLDVLGFDAADYTGLIDTFDMSGSAIKGTLRLVKLGDPKKFLAFLVTARTTATGYRKLTVTPIPSSTANPFATGDVVLAQFTSSGERGPEGRTGYQVLQSVTVTTPVAQIDFLNLFSDDYDKYAIEVQGLTCNTASTDYPRMRLAIGGVVDSNPSYIGLSSPGNTASTTDAFSLLNGIGAGATNIYADLTGTIEIYNARSTTRAKTVTLRGATAGAPCFGAGRYGVLGRVSGFRIYLLNGSNIDAGTVRVYGLKNTFG